VHTEFPLIGKMLCRFCSATPVGIRQFHKPRGKAVLPVYAAYLVPNVLEAYRVMDRGITILIRKEYNR
jgi:hypothetical protein